MKLSSLYLPLILALALLSSTAQASLTGTYQGSFLTGTSGGGAFSYLHSATSHSMLGGAGYYQKAGGSVLFAVDNRDSFLFTYLDNGTSGVVDAGDLVGFNFTVDILEYDGSLDGTNTLLDVVGTMRVWGTLDVGSDTDPHSSDFDNAISNISAASMAAPGLNYDVQLIDSASGFSAGDSFAGDAFFQQADYTGPFNGISFDTNNNSLEFALWGDSRNTTNNNTGQYQDNQGNISAHAMGFDFRVSGQRVSFLLIPEPSAAMTWSLLMLSLVSLRTRKKRI